MSHDFLVAAIAGGLFAAFVLGWIAGWLTLRTVHGRGQALAHLAATQADAASAQAKLREAMIEIEELRAYIDRRIVRQQDDPHMDDGQAG